MKNMVVIGNCQAAPLTYLLNSTIKKYFNVKHLKFVHLCTAEDEKDYIYECDNADLIIDQRVSGEFPQLFCQTSFLKENYSDKIIIWPSVYFDGYFPTLGYINNLNNKIIPGPLDDYHFKFIFNAFQTGLSEKVCNNLFVEGNENLSSSIDNSIKSLQQRESEVDIKISDFIISNLNKQKLFYTPNHPKNEVLLEIAKRIIKILSIELDDNDLNLNLHALDYIDIPTLPFISKNTESYIVNGYDYEFNSGGNNYITKKEVRKLYSSEELISNFYGIYKKLF